MTDRPLEIVLGTRNEKKKGELMLLLQGIDVRVSTLNEYPDSITVEETGTTFQENAMLKATEQAKHLGRWVMGEDSGLAVDALGGRPGVYSARYAGTDGDDQANNRLLLQELQGVPRERRTAHYVCHMSLSDPAGHIHIDCEARCNGRILDAPRGTAGFGYDPLFEISEYHRTFAELGDAVKSVLSHRARAMDQFLRALLPLLRSPVAS